MVATNFDEKKLRQELIEVYERFIEDPQDKKNCERFSELDRKYSGANDLIHDQTLVMALNNWSFLWQKNLPGQEDNAIDPKKMLRKLKENK